jgi:glycerate kinase
VVLVADRKRVVIAPDSFKGSLKARDVAAALASGWLAVRPNDDVMCAPMADGGEGTLDAIEVAIAGSIRMPVFADALDGQRIDASWLLLPDGTGVIELSETSGLTLTQRPRPLDAHTFGFGQAIAAALEHGVERLVLALGGSASTDGGVGALIALGGRFTSATGAPIGFGGRALKDLDRVELAGLLSLPPRGVVILADVTNPLCGPRGAAAVFGPQKGATAADVEVLENALARFAALGGGDPDLPGAGAAGGAAYGLLLWGATLQSGARFVAETIGLSAALAAADLVLTGEGRFDRQSANGKAPVAVMRIAAEAEVPVALVAGQIEASIDGFMAAVELRDLAGSAQAAIAWPVKHLEEAGRYLAHAFSVSTAAIDR